MDQEILVIGHNAQLKKELVDSLTGNDWQVRAMPNGVGPRLISCLPQVALVVLDVSPAETGEWESLQKLRERSTVPVIALVTENDYRVRIECLDNGADYVMTKPIGGKELGARVGALLRRTRMIAQPFVGPVETQMPSAIPSEARPVRQL